MNISKPIILTPDNESRFQNFILIEVTSSRLSDGDLFIHGDKVREMYDMLTESLIEDDDIKSQIILNRIAKVGQMMDLLPTYGGVYLTKFFDRVWRRYSYVSNVGEPFLDLPTFLKFFPEYADDKYSLLSQRIDDDDEDMSSTTNNSEDQSSDDQKDVETVDTVETKDVTKETVSA